MNLIEPLIVTDRPNQSLPSGRAWRIRKFTTPSGARSVEEEKREMCTTPNQTQPAGARRADGFTLVELLMVIALISILVGLVTFAARRALFKGNEARVLTEVGLLSNAIEQYKIEHGSYPPNPGTATAASGIMGFETAAQRGARISRHVSRAFPRFTGDYSEFRDHVFDATRSAIIAEDSGAVPSHIENGLDVDYLDPAEALVFWIGGLPRIYVDADGNYSYELTRFSMNPSNPFQPENNDFDTAIPQGSQRTQQLFEFDVRRLVDRDGDGWPEFVPTGNSAALENPPYVYFDAPTYDLGARYPYHPDVEPDLVDYGWGYAMPYASRIAPNASGGASPWKIEWVNRNGFQLLTAGVDGSFGEAVLPYIPDDDSETPNLRAFPDGTNFTESDLDNLSNFSDQRLGSAVEAEGATE